MSEEITYRRMTIEDVPAVLEIEHEAFTQPWTEDSFVYEMKENQFSYYLVALVDEKIVGYCGAWLVMDECHITNIAVLQAYRKRGIGEGLMRRAIEACQERGVRVMTLEVRVSNHAAQNMYRKLGFHEGGIRKNYYTDDHEDALVMWVELV